MTEPIRLIIDCDPGIDDALALLLAAARPDQIRLEAVTCVVGNRPVETTTRNARAVLDAAAAHAVPVYQGSALPLGGGPVRCNLVHGEDGLGGVEIKSHREPEAQDAVGYLEHTLLAEPTGSLTLVALGPLTNLARVERAHPGALRRLKRLLVMGGALTCPGNVTPFAEFNFYADPVSAQEVMRAANRIELFGLDVTSKASMGDDWIESLDAGSGLCARLAQQMLRAYAALDPLLHDACPVAHLLHPELFSGAGWNVSVETAPGAHEGQSHGVEVSNAASANVFAYFEVDCKGLLELVRQSLHRLP